LNNINIANSSEFKNWYKDLVQLASKHKKSVNHSWKYYFDRGMSAKEAFCSKDEYPELTKVILG
jgi:hypothetical protein